MPSCSVHSYDGVSRTFWVEGVPASSGTAAGGSVGGGVWAELKQGLAALGRRAGLGSTWLLRSLHDQSAQSG